MPRNGSGSFTRSVSDYVAGTDILAADVNGEMDDIATAITDSIAKDGQTTATANLPMGTFRHTGVGNASARNHYAATGQVQDSGFLWGGTAGGTADARTITLTPAITAYAAGQVFRFINGTAVNTGATTLAVNGLTATAVRKGLAATALEAGDLPADAAVEVLYDGTVFRLMAVQPSGAGILAMRGTGFLPTAGGTLTGSLSVTGTANIFGPAATQRSLYFGTDAERRWIMQAEETAEGGANAGSNFRLMAYDDSDTLIGEVFYVTRSTRVVDFKVAPTVNGVAVNTSAADITAVTAGVGLTGGGSTGAVTLDMTTTFGAVGTYAWSENGTGGVITAGSTMAGSAFTTPLTGTWRNMTNASVGNGSSGLWMRTA